MWLLRFCLPERFCGRVFGHWWRLNSSWSDGHSEVCVLCCAYRQVNGPYIH